MAAAGRRWSLYLVRTHMGALYTGIAIDVGQRFAAHGTARGAKALRGRGPLVLAFTVEVGSRSSALRLEARIKRLPKAEKERVVADGMPRGWLRAVRSVPSVPAISGT